MKPEHNIESPLIPTRVVAQMLGVSKDHFRKHIKHQSNFPKPRTMTPNGHPKWRITDIMAYIDGKDFKKAA